MEPSAVITIAVDLTGLDENASVSSVAVSEQAIVSTAVLTGPRGNDGAPGPGVPTGGYTNQTIFKTSDDDYSTVFRNILQSDVTNLSTDLAGKELVSNKSTSTSLGTSDTLYPSQKAVKAYADARVSKVGDSMTGPLGISPGVAGTTVQTVFDITSNIPGDSSTTGPPYDGPTTLTAPLARVNVTDTTNEQWAFNVENYGRMTSVEVNDRNQKNFHENGLSVTSIAPQLLSIIQQGYVNFRLQDPTSTADVLQIDNEGTGIAAFVNNNADAVAFYSLKDFFNKNQTKNTLFIDDYSRTNDGNTYTKTGATVFFRHRAQELSGGHITDTSSVLAVFKENTTSTGNVADFRQYGDGRAVSIMNNGTKETLYMDVNGDAEGLYIDTEATTAAAIFASGQNTSGNTAYILNQGALSSASNGAVFRAQQSNASATAPVIMTQNNGTGDSLFLNTDGDSNSIDIDSEATTKTAIFAATQNTSGSSVYILSEGVHGTGTIGSLVRLQMANSASSAPVINIDNNGTGRAIVIDHDDTGSNPSFDIDRDGSSASQIKGAFIDVDNASTGGAIGLDISNITATSGSVIGQRIALPSGGSTNYALQLSDTTGVAAGGITFGTDVTLYRSAADTLMTDDKLVALGGLKITNASTTGYVWTATDTVGNGSWQAATGGSGSGDVIGPSSATDNAITRFDTTTGKLIQNSTVTIDDTGLAAGLRQSSILDSNGNIIIGTSPTASADSYFRFANAVAGTVIADVISSTANAGMSLRTKGTGTHSLRPGGNSTSSFTAQDSSGNAVLRVDSTNKMVSVGSTAPAPTSTMHVSGSFSKSIVNKTTTYAATATDSTITGDTTAGAFTVTLPTAVGIDGRIYTIKKIDAAANTLTVGTTSSQTIDGVTTYALTTQWKYVEVQSNGTNWLIIGNN